MQVGAACMGRTVLQQPWHAAQSCVPRMRCPAAHVYVAAAGQLQRWYAELAQSCVQLQRLPYAFAQPCSGACTLQR